MRLKTQSLPIFAILGIILFSLVACSQDKSKPETKANPAVLDWHLQFASAEASALFRCEQVTSLDETRVLFEPITVTVQATLITPQILDQAKRILQATDSTFAKAIQNIINNPTSVMVLFSLRFESDRPIYEPFEISPSVYPDELHTLDEIEFQLGDLDTPAQASLKLNWKGLDLAPNDSGFPDSMQVNTVYLLIFDLSRETIPENATQRMVQLTLTLSMISPFRFDFCDVGNVHPLTFDLPLVGGDAKAIMDNYGTLTTRLTTEQIEALRLAILTEVVNQYSEITP